MKRTWFLVLAVVALVSPILAQSSPAAQIKPATPPTRSAQPIAAGMTNQDVVKMVAAGLAEDVIISAVRQAPKRNFNLTSGGLISLKQANVSDAVIRVMQGQSIEAPKPSEELRPAVAPQPSAAPVAAAPVTPSVPIPPPPTVVALRNGSHVKVRLMKELSSETAKMGDRVEFEVVDDVTVDGHVVIRQGSIALGKITQATSQHLTRSGKIEFSIDSVKAVNAGDVVLSANESAEGGRTVGKRALIVGLAGIRGKEATVAAGSEFTAKTDGDRSLTLSASASDGASAPATRPAGNSVAVLSAKASSVHAADKTLGKIFIKASSTTIDGHEFQDREKEDSAKDLKNFVPNKSESNKFVLVENEQDADYLLIVVERSSAVAGRGIELRATISVKENGQWKAGARVNGIANGVWRAAAERLMNDAAKWVREQQK